MKNMLIPGAQHILSAEFTSNSPTCHRLFTKLLTIETRLPNGASAVAGLLVLQRGRVCVSLCHETLSVLWASSGSPPGQPAREQPRRAKQHQSSRTKITANLVEVQPWMQGGSHGSS